MCCFMFTIVSTWFDCLHIVLFTVVSNGFYDLHILLFLCVYSCVKTVWLFTYVSLRLCQNYLTIYILYVCLRLQLCQHDAIISMFVCLRLCQHDLTSYTCFVLLTVVCLMFLSIYVYALKQLQYRWCWVVNVRLDNRHYVALAYREQLFVLVFRQF